MSVLKKLVCKRVRSDNGDSGVSRRFHHDDSTPPGDDNALSISSSVKASSTERSKLQILTTTPPRSSCRYLNRRFSAQEKSPVNFQHQMQELDAFAQLTEDHFREGIATTRPEVAQGNIPDSLGNNAYIVKQIQKSLRPAKEANRTRGSVRNNFFNKQLYLHQFRIGRTRSRRTDSVISKLGDGSCGNNGSCGNRCDSKEESAEAKECSLVDSDPICDESLQWGLHRGIPLEKREKRDDSIEKRGTTATRPKSLRCTQPQGTSKGESVGTKRTRFAEELEERFILPALQDVEKADSAPSRFLGYNPNGNACKSILRPSTPLNCRYFMSTDNEAKCGYDDDEEVFDWKNEEQASTMVSDDQSDVSSELSLDDLSHNSLGSVELLFNFLFCSPVNALSRSDWLR